MFSGGGGGWYNFDIDGYTKRFRSSEWINLLKEDEELRTNVLKAMEQEVIEKFSNQEGNASDFYETDDEAA